MDWGGLDIYLLRNENLFKIYRFSDAKAIEPDFVLFLKEKKTEKTCLYQLFIESKGDGLLIQDKWKEDFLKEIEANCKVETFLENSIFKVVGMPFFNENTKQIFNDEFNKKLKLGFFEDEHQQNWCLLQSQYRVFLVELQCCRLRQEPSLLMPDKARLFRSATRLSGPLPCKP